MFAEHTACLRKTIIPFLILVRKSRAKKEDLNLTRLKNLINFG